MFYKREGKEKKKKKRGKQADEKGRERGREAGSKEQSKKTEEQDLVRNFLTTLTGLSVHSWRQIIKKIYFKNINL